MWCSPHHIPSSGWSIQIWILAPYSQLAKAWKGSLYHHHHHYSCQVMQITLLLYTHIFCVISKCLHVLVLSCFFSLCTLVAFYFLIMPITFVFVLYNFSPVLFKVSGYNVHHYFQQFVFLAMSTMSSVVLIIYILPSNCHNWFIFYISNYILSARKKNISYERKQSCHTIFL